jgi:hypothetical protein
MVSGPGATVVVVAASVVAGSVVAGSVVAGSVVAGSVAAGADVAVVEPAEAELGGTLAALGVAVWLSLEQALVTTRIAAHRPTSAGRAISRQR